MKQVLVATIACCLIATAWCACVDPATGQSYSPGATTKSIVEGKCVEFSCTDKGIFFHVGNSILIIDAGQWTQTSSTGCVSCSLNGQTVGVGQNLRYYSTVDNECKSVTCDAQDQFSAAGTNPYVCKLTSNTWR
jgi:hypothetical protein